MSDLTSNKEHQKKVEEATNMCDSALQSFLTHLDKVLPAKDAPHIKQLIIKNTYFAGGLFRSVFTGNTPNDLDVWFSNEEAMSEFKHYFLQKTHTGISVSENGTFGFKFYRDMYPKISFVTLRCGAPEELLAEFDFSFNQHYYDMFNGAYQFDIDTFSKIGRLIDSEHNPVNTLGRLVKFSLEGFSVLKADMPTLINAVVSEFGGITNREAIKSILENSASEAILNRPGILPLTGHTYSDNITGAEEEIRGGRTIDHAIRRYREDQELRRSRYATASAQPAPSSAPQPPPIMNWRADPFRSE